MNDQFDLGALLGGMNFDSVLQQVQGMQNQLQEAQETLKTTEFSAQAGNGLVEATILGTGELVRLKISPQVCDPDDTETLADLIIAACRKANSLATDKMRQIVPEMPDLSLGEK